MLLHNHLSGSLNPSKDDIELTRRVIEAGTIMNIPVIDHLIVGGGTAELVSIREEKPEIFGIREEAKYENRPKTNIREMLDKNREKGKGCKQKNGEGDRAEKTGFKYLEKDRTII